MICPPFFLFAARSPAPYSDRMGFANWEPCLRQTSSVLYIAVDELIPLKGKSHPGLDEFTATLDHQAIPAVWLTSRSRLQFDDARRKHAHTHPFIAEDGCAVFLPEDYFHLRPASDASPTKTKRTATVRLGRFTCLPVAQALPAAAEALQTLSQDTGVPIVTLRSLSPRELVQNTGLPQKEAELVRQRDFTTSFSLPARQMKKSRASLRRGTIAACNSADTACSGLPPSAPASSAASATSPSSTTARSVTTPTLSASPRLAWLRTYSHSASALFC